MATHQELTNLLFEDGQYRFCLDRVIRDEGDSRTEYAFVWRGTAQSPDGFVLRPAYFSFRLLGKLLHKTIAEGILPEDEASEFLLFLIGG